MARSELIYLLVLPGIYHLGESKIIEYFSDRTSNHHISTNSKVKKPSYLKPHQYDVIVTPNVQSVLVCLCDNIAVVFKYSVLCPQPRDPFVMMRGAKKADIHLMEEVATCSELKQYKRRGADVIQLLIAHGQRADDLAVFLYSVLDVPVAHAFFLNTRGELNMKNFQRFESKVSCLVSLGIEIKPIHFGEICITVGGRIFGYG